MIIINDWDTHNILNGTNYLGEQILSKNAHRFPCVVIKLNELLFYSKLCKTRGIEV